MILWTKYCSNHALMRVVFTVSYSFSSNVLLRPVNDIDMHLQPISEMFCFGLFSRSPLIEQPIKSTPLYQPIYIRCFLAQEKQPAHLEHNTQFRLTIPLVRSPGTIEAGPEFLPGAFPPPHLSLSTQRHVPQNHHFFLRKYPRTTIDSASAASP
jgi:hypothetical protein